MNGLIGGVTRDERCQKVSVLMGRNQNCIWEDHGSHALFKRNYIPKWEHHARHPANNVCIKAHVTIAHIYATLDQNLTT
jgi:hypothetical protein